VDGNPLRDMSVLRNVRVVIQGGRVVARDGELVETSSS
jgi:hypothetical protein